MKRSQFRSACLLVGALHTLGGCLPSGPKEYDGPTYEVLELDAGPVQTLEAGAVDAGVFDAGTLDAGGLNVGTDAGKPADAGTVAMSDAGGGTGTGGALSACTFRVTTNAPSGTYANAYVCAIWVQNSAGKLVRTLAYYAGERARYLSAYSAARGSATVDTVTGATINRSESKTAGADTVQHTLTWDLTNSGSNVVPDGAYAIRVETTSHNGAGNVVNVDFTKGTSVVDVSPANSGNVTSLSLHCE